MSRPAMVPVRRWVERRAVVVAAAVVLFAAVFAAREIAPGTSDAVALLYVVPVSLFAVELGLVGGLTAAAVAVSLMGVWALSANVDLGVVGMLTRAVTYLAVGIVGGRFSDRMRAAQRRQHQLLESGLELAHLDAADRLPGLLAERARELTASAGARVELDGGSWAESGVWRPERTGETVLIEARGQRYGSVTLSRPSPADAEERAALTIVALQAAVAAENVRLLESERERAAIQAQLHDTRLQLGDRARQLRELFGRQEAERHETANELSENAAQMLAGMMLGLSALERRLKPETGGESFNELRSDLGAAIQLLRSIAAGLRPPVRGLGLRATLEQLASRASGFDEITIAVGDDIGPLTEEVETSIYRIVEEAVSAIGAGRSLKVQSDRDGRELVLEVGAGEESIAPQQIALLRARVELAGGRLEATDANLRAVIPVGDAGTGADGAQASRDADPQAASLR